MSHSPLSQLDRAGQLLRLDEIRRTLAERWSAALRAAEYGRADAYGRAVYRAGRMWDALAFDEPDYRHKAIERNAQLKCFKL